MEEFSDLAGRTPGEPSLDQTLDKDTGEHVFALKRWGKVLAVARFQEIQEPMRCFYFREIRTNPVELGKGHASTLMQEVTDVMMEQGTPCVAYQMSGDEQSAKMLRDCGWRSVEPERPTESNIWTLNLPPEQDANAVDVIVMLGDSNSL